eukprot:TRINITY_DN11302_c0_g2_i3.p1 TRINITY_DN11302_c0_g2~~TRINITY_DN11302_c0_g2_i3.p1  ORF type:complete len:421 (-),score=64.88 TRINITY_DN11302_c0_g2_i3:386-1648(-)
MANSRRGLSLLTTVICLFLMFVYTGSYSHDHQFGQYSVHYPRPIYVLILTVLGVLHLLLSAVIVLFHVLAYSQWKINTGIEQFKEDNPGVVLGTGYLMFLTISFFFQDEQLVFKLGLAMISFLGLHFDFLIFSVHLMDVCSQVETLSKVFAALFATWDQVVGTVGLGFSIQYVFLAIGFLTFSSGYGFADKNPIDCDALFECLLGHLDYGFRSAPVWAGPGLNWWMLFFDYMYNLLVILILAAIISGIIIDTFANMRAELVERNDNQENNCFICSINRSVMERKMVKFDQHVYQDHYMWSYARFLMYVRETQESDLNGPESYVKAKVNKKEYTFYPVGRSLSMDADAEEFQERALRIKDLEEVKGIIKGATDSMDAITQLERELKTSLKESMDAVADLQSKVQGLQGDLLKKGFGDPQNS